MNTSSLRLASTLMSLCVTAFLTAPLLSDPARAEHVVVDPDAPEPSASPKWSAGMKAATEAYNQGDYSEAAKLAAKALKLAESQVEKARTYILLSYIEAERGNVDAALKHNDAALAIVRKDFPDDVKAEYDLLNQRGGIFLKAGRRQEFRSTMAQALDVINRKKGDVWDEAKDRPPVHKLTGLTCPLKLKGAEFAEASIFSLEGDDVACSYRPSSNNGMTITFYFTRLAAGQTTDDFFEASVKEIQMVYQGVKPEVSTRRSVDGLSLREAIYHLPDFQGAASGSGLWMANLSGWSLKARVTQTERLDLQAARALVEDFFAHARKSATKLASTEPATSP
jgi:tetratricopeptide (TPR) repeat protein